jgi:hypothetical protein
MNSNHVNQQVARATGETVAEIRRRGFSLEEPLPEEPILEEPDDLIPLMIDWDRFDLERNVALIEQPPRRFGIEPDSRGIEPLPSGDYAA